MSAAVDLSRDAIHARREAKAATGRDGGWTARELVDVAARVYRESNRLRKVADRRQGRRHEKALAKATKALLTAATQIRIAQRCETLDRPYLHALTLPQIQKVKEEVKRDADRDIAALAVDTHRRIQDQRRRIGGTLR